MNIDTGDHFIGRYEVEKKFRCNDLSAAADRLAQLHAQPFMQGGREIDKYFDQYDRRLTQSNQGLVIRSMQPSERVLIITKGPGPDACSSIETRDFDKVCEMFVGLGYQQIRHIEKQRDVYFLGKCHVTLDHVEQFGTFVEVAIMVQEEHQLSAARALVDATVSKLGLKDLELETRSYAEMIDGHT